MREDFELFFSKQSIVTQFCPVFGIVFSLAYHIVTIFITIIRFNHLNNNNRSFTKVPYLYGRFSRFCLSLYTHVESKFQLLHLKSTKSIKYNIYMQNINTHAQNRCALLMTINCEIRWIAWNNKQNHANTSFLGSDFIFMIVCLQDAWWWLLRCYTKTCVYSWVCVCAACKSSLPKLNELNWIKYWSKIKRSHLKKEKNRD